MKKISITKILLTSTFLLYSANSFASTDTKDTANNTGAADPTEMSLDELMNQQVYSASKRPEKISETASSVYVITAEDIARAGVTSIPEALRMVPGVDVAQTNANTWAISIRGFNAQYSNKLLVLIDGRSVYTPTFSGVYWDAQDYVLDDIERIEVIRGPGGTLWGANAVNGVINIITKEARKTQGNYASATVGSNHQDIGEYRYGGKIGDMDYYRVYGKLTNEGSFDNAADTTMGNHDNWDKAQGGFRYDFRDADLNKVTLSADTYDGKKDLPLGLPNSSAPPFITPLLINEGFQGANAMLNWNITTDKFNTDIKAYSDYTARNDMPVLSQAVYTQDLNIQTQYNYDIHSLIGGAEFRYITDDLQGSVWDSYADPKSSNTIWSAFLQDKVAVVDNKLFLTLGSKFDYNDYTDFGLEPNVRLAYQINDRHTLWAAISQAIRTPTRGEDDFKSLTPSGPPLGIVQIVGNNSYGNEDLTAYEVGYRGDITNKTFVDISAFYNNYTKLRTTEQISVGAPPIIETSFNNGYAENYGFEAYSVMSLMKNWDLKPGYSLLIQDFHKTSGSTDLLLQEDQDRSPVSEFTLGSFVKVTPEVNWDTNLYYVSRLFYYADPTSPITTKINDYTRLDTQIRWNVLKDVEISLIGQNLLREDHQEFNEVFLSQPSTIPRTVLAQIKVKF